MSIVDSVRNIISMRDIIRERLGYMGLLPDANVLRLSFGYSGTTENASDTELYEYITVERTNTNVTVNYDYAELGMAEDDFAMTISNFKTTSIVITPKKIRNEVEIWVVNPAGYISDDSYEENCHAVYFFYGSDFKKKPSITFNLPSYKLWIRNLSGSANQLGTSGYGSILSLDIVAASQRQLYHCVNAMLNMNIQNALDKTLTAGSSYTFQPGYYREGGIITAIPSGDISDLEQEYYNRLYVNFDAPAGNPDGGAIKLINDLRGENYDLYTRMYVDWDPEESGDDGGASQVIANINADYLAEFELRKKYERYLYTDYNQLDYSNAINQGKTGGAYGRIKKYYDMIYVAEGDAIEEMYLDFYEFVGQYESGDSIPGIYGQLARVMDEAANYKYKLQTDYDTTDSVLDGGAIGLMNKYKNYLYTTFDQTDYNNYISSGMSGGAYGKIMELTEGFNILKENNTQLQQDYDSLQTEYNHFRYEDHGIRGIYRNGEGAEDTIKYLDKFLYKEFNQGDYDTFVDGGGVTGAYGKIKTLEDSNASLSNSLYHEFNQSEYDEWIESGHTTGAYGKIYNLETQLSAEQARSQKLYDKLVETLTRLQNI